MRSSGESITSDRTVPRWGKLAVAAMAAGALLAGCTQVVQGEAVGAVQPAFAAPQTPERPAIPGEPKQVCNNVPKVHVAEVLHTSVDRLSACNANTSSYKEVLIMAKADVSNTAVYSYNSLRLTMVIRPDMMPEDALHPDPTRKVSFFNYSMQQGLRNNMPIEQSKLTTAYGDFPAYTLRESDALTTMGVVNMQSMNDQYNYAAVLESWDRQVLPQTDRRLLESLVADMITATANPRRY